MAVLGVGTCSLEYCQHLHYFLGFAFCSPLVFGKVLPENPPSNSAIREGMEGRRLFTLGSRVSSAPGGCVLVASWSGSMGPGK